MLKQVSYRVQGTNFGPLGCIYFDLIMLLEVYNDDKWISYFYIDGIRYHWALIHKKKSGCQEAIVEFVS